MTASIEVGMREKEHRKSLCLIQTVLAVGTYCSMHLVLLERELTISFTASVLGCSFL